MPIIEVSHDSLPYIDAAPSVSEKAYISGLLGAEQPASPPPPHPSLPRLREPRFTPLMAAELERVARGEPMEGGVDVSRYGAPSMEGIQGGFTAGVFLDGRLANLSLLAQEVGRNAWLVHNAGLEGTLRGLEGELMALRTECEVVNKGRKAAQKDVEPELRRLEERWRRGVGRVLETELAAEMVRREVLERRRAAR